MNIRDIFLTASSNMLQSKLRTILTVIAIFIGATTLSLTNGMGEGVSAYIDKQLGNLGAEDALIVRPDREDAGIAGKPQKYNPERSTETGSSGVAIPVMQEQDLETVRRQEGIKSAEPLLTATPEYITAGGDKYQAMLAPYIEGTRLDLTAGNGFSGQNGNAVILPVAFMEPLGFSSPEEAIGRNVTFGAKSPSGQIQEVQATVAGVQQESVAGPTGVAANDTLVKDLLNIQTQGLPEQARNRYPAVIARFDPSMSDEQLQSIKDSLKGNGYRAMTIEETIGLIKQVLDAIIVVLNFFAIIALVAASFGIVNTLLMAVQERTKEIGLMKAMGMDSNRIFLLFSTEAVLLGFWGSMLGILAGNGIGRLINRIASETFLKDLPGFTLMSFPWQSMATIVLVIMGVAFVAGTLPARRAAGKDPIEALRYE